MRELKTKEINFKNTGYLLKRIAVYDKKLIIYMMVAGITEMIMPLATLGLTAVLLDAFSQERSLVYFFTNVSILLGLLLGSTILSKCLINSLDNRGNEFRVSLFVALGMKLTRVDYKLFDGNKGQETINKGAAAVENTYSGIQPIFSTGESFVKNLLGIIIYGTLLGRIHGLFLVAIISVSVINFLYGLYLNKQEDKNKKVISPLNQKLQYFNDRTVEYKATKDMRLFKMNNWFNDMFQDIIGQKQSALFTLDKIRFIGTVLAAVGSLLVNLLAYIYLIRLLSLEMITIAEFSIYFGSIAILSRSIEGVFQNIVEFNRIGLFVEDYQRFLTLQSVFKEKGGISSAEQLDKQLSIEFKNVTYRYPDAEVFTFEDLNLKIDPGEKVAIVGINGAGKTTLVKLLSGLYLPDSGSILIGGCDREAYNIDEYYRLFSVVFQDYFELPISIEETILQGQQKNASKLKDVLRLSGLDQIVQELEHGTATKLVKRIHSDAVDFSGGQKQKLQLAKALYKDGPILLLDEPTAALDPIAENEIYQHYEALSKDKTAIFISHRLSSTRFCDRILFMEDGKIIEEGSHNQLMKQKGKYHEMFETQSYYYKKKVGETS